MADLRSIVRTPLLVESPLSRYRSAGGERRLHHEHAVLISEGEGDAASHLAAVFGPLSRAELLELTRGSFDNGEFELVIESETASRIENELKALEWTCVEEETAMVLTEIPAAMPLPPPDLDIVMVSTEESYEDYMTVVPGNRSWVPSLGAATDPQVGLFVGYVDGIPVATARLTCYGEIAEITAIQTLENRRRRGYGSAMTWASIQEAARRGCRVIMLTATEMGHPLYRKMGFVDVCRYRVYEPPRVG